MTKEAGRKRKTSLFIFSKRESFPPHTFKNNRAPSASHNPITFELHSAQHNYSHLDVGESLRVGKVFQSAGSKASEVGRELSEPKPREESLSNANMHDHNKNNSSNNKNNSNNSNNNNSNNR